MMDVKHSLGILRYRAPHGAFGHEVEGDDGLVCQMNHHPAQQDRAKADAERVVLTWNAHDALVTETTAKSNRIQYLEANQADLLLTNDALLGALKIAREYVLRADPCTFQDDGETRQALAKVDAALALAGAA